MKLYIKQKVFSWNDSFTVKDEFEEDRYYVDGEIFTLGKKLHVTDRIGREAAFIKQKVWSFLPKFYVYINDVQIAEIIKEFTFFIPKYTAVGLGWDIEGSIMEHNYTVSRNGIPIATISKAWFTWGDSYEIDIADPADELPVLAVVLAIDCVQADSSSAN